MFEIYKLANKIFLKELLKFHGLVALIFLPIFMFQQIESLKWVATLAMGILLILGMLALFHVMSFSASLRKKNFVWISQLAFSAKHKYFGHLVFCLVATLESYVLVAFWGGVIFSLSYITGAFPEGSFWSEGILTYLELWAAPLTPSFWMTFFSEIFKSSRSILIGLLALALSAYVLLFIPRTDHKIIDRKSSLYGMGAIAFLVYISKLIPSFPLELFFLPLGIIAICYVLYHNYYQSFGLRFLPRKLVHSALAVSWLGLFSFSLVHSHLAISQKKYHKNLVSEYKFLGFFAPRADQEIVEKVVESPKTHLRELDELYKMATGQKLKKFSFKAPLVEAWKKLEEPKQLRMRLNFYDLNSLAQDDYFKLMGRKFDSKHSWQEQGWVDLLFQRPLTSDEYLRLLGPAYSQAVRVRALEAAVYIEKPLPLLKKAYKNGLVKLLNPKKLQDIVSLALGKKVDVFKLSNKKFIERSLASVHDCQGIKLNAETLGLALRCSNRAYYQRLKKGEKTNFIRRWPMFPLHSKVKEVLKKNLETI